MNQDIVIDDKWRKQMFYKLEAESAKVLDFLQLWSRNINEGRIGEGTPTMTKAQFVKCVLKCFKAWLAFEFHPDLVATIPYTYSELIKLTLGLDPQYITTQARCISYLIVSTSGSHSQQLLESAKRDLGIKIVSFVPLYYRENNIL